MSKTLLLSSNTLKMIFSKKSGIMVFIVLPVLTALLSMVIFGGVSDKRADIGIYDADQTPVSQNLSNYLSRSGSFNLIPLEESSIKSKLTGNRVECVVSIPKGYANSILSGKPLPIDLISIKGEASSAWVKSAIDGYADNLTLLAGFSKGDNQTFNELAANLDEAKQPSMIQQKTTPLEDKYTLKGMSHLSTGFLIMFMMLAASMTAELILKEKRSRTFFRICAAPIRPTSYILGNVLTNSVIMLIQSLVVLSFMVFVQGSLPLENLLFVLVPMLTFGICSIGLSMLIVSWSKTSNQANIVSGAILAPTCMLGGCFWNNEEMPSVMQKIAGFTPQKWVIDAMNTLQDKGSWIKATPYLGIVLAFAAAFFLIAAYRFKRNDNVSSFV